MEIWQEESAGAARRELPEPRLETCSMRVAAILPAVVSCSSISGKDDIASGI